MVPAACASDRQRLTQRCARRTGRSGVVTQNIDALHQQAGSVRVCELHGHLREASCVDCADVVIRHDVAEVLPLVLNEVMCDE